MAPVRGIIVLGSTCVFPELICSCGGKPEWKPSGDERQDVKNGEETSAVGRDISAHKGPLQWASGACWGRSATMVLRQPRPCCRHNIRPGEAGRTHQGPVSLGELISPRVGSFIDSPSPSQSRCKLTLGSRSSSKFNLFRSCWFPFYNPDTDACPRLV